MHGICYRDFSMDNLLTCHWEIIVRYMWRFIGIGDLQCFTSGTWIIIDGPPLVTFQRVWRSIPTKRHGQSRRLVGSIIVHHSGSTVQPRCVRGKFWIWLGYFYRRDAPAGTHHFEEGYTSRYTPLRGGLHQPVHTTSRRVTPAVHTTSRRDTPAIHTTSRRDTPAGTQKKGTAVHA